MALLGLDSVLSSGDVNLGGACAKMVVSVTERPDAGPSLGRCGGVGDGVTQALACGDSVTWVGGCDGAHLSNPTHRAATATAVLRGGNSGMAVVTVSTLSPAISTG